MRRLELLDLYRGLAVLAVLLYHYTARFETDYYGYTSSVPQATYGYLGVHFFFAISGFCIMLTARTHSSAAQFIIRRLSRIYPALITAVVITFAVKALFPLPGREVGVTSVVASLLFLGGLPIRLVDGAYWSLIVEMKFYLIFAIIYYKPKWIPYQLVVVGLLVAAAFGLTSSDLIRGSAVFEDNQISPNSLINQITFLKYFPWFLMGIGLNCLHYYGKSHKRSWGLTIASLVGIFAVSFRVPMVLVAAVLSLFLLLLVVWFPSIRIPRWLTFFGAISYPLYLVHQEVGVIVIRNLSPLGNDLLKIAFAAIVTTGIGTAIHFTTEMRYRKAFEKVMHRLLRVFVGTEEKSIVKPTS